MPASQTTTVGTWPKSVRIFTSIDANPKIALVGRPSEVEIDSGSAKNARYASEFPSIRNSSRGVSPLPDAMVLRLVVVRARTSAEPGAGDRYAGDAASRCFVAPGRLFTARTLV